MEGKICLVTGASRGIGFHTALGLARKGAFVVLASHNRQRGERAGRRINAFVMRSITDFIPVDLSSQGQIREFAKTFRSRYDHLDVLVNNAGGFFLKRRESGDGIEMTLALNHLNYFMTTWLLMDTFRSSDAPRVVNVTSEAHRGAQMNFDDIQFEQGYSGRQAYNQSKLANLLFTYELARRLADTNVMVNAVHPGLVKTQLGKQNSLVRAARKIIDLFAKSPKEGAETPVYLASSPDMENITGQYFIDKEQVSSSPESHNADSAHELWNISQELCHLDDSVM